MAEKLTLDHKELAIGRKVQFAFTLQVGAKKACKVRLEYAVHFAKAGGRVSKKVFKITENAFAPGEHTVIRKHAFVDMSTRRHHPGEHRMTIVVNGVEKAQKSLTLTK